MPENTLLSLLTGGRYGTSADLPTIPETAHSYIDQIKESYDQQQQRPTQIQGTGLGMLEWANIGVPFGASKQMAPLFKAIKDQLRWEKAQMSVLGKYLGKESVDASNITKDKMTTALIEQLMNKYSKGLPQFKSLQDLDKYVGFEKHVGRRVRELSGMK
jgi:hypothetical protein